CTRAPQPSGRQVAIIACALVIVAIGIGGVACKQKSDPTERTETREGSPLANPAKETDAGGGREYMKVVDKVYEINGLAHGAKCWLKVDSKPGFKDLRGTEAAMVMARAFDPAIKSAEFASVEQRKMFLDWHGMDSKTWRAEFIKRYPERELINDEIQVVVQ